MTELIQDLHSHNWHVRGLFARTGMDFHYQEQLAELTGGPCRVAFRMPGQGKPLPPADVVLACPLTFDSTNKCAQGLATTSRSPCYAEWSATGALATVANRRNTQSCRLTRV